MQGINVTTNRKKAALGGSFDLDAPKVLDNIKELIKGRTHAESGLQFGGAMLAPHISKDIFKSKVVPIHDKMMNLGGAARDHPLADEMLTMQHQILQGKPKLREMIRNLHVVKNLDETPENPFEHMNDKQLYHHVMNMSMPEWSKVQETAGVIAGKAKSRLSSALSRGELHKIIDDHAPMLKEIVKPLSDDGTAGEAFNKVSHLMDISMSRMPKVAAERLEREVEGGSFADVLKSSIWVNALAELKKSKIPAHVK